MKMLKKVIKIVSKARYLHIDLTNMTGIPVKRLRLAAAMTLSATLIATMTHAAEPAADSSPADVESLEPVVKLPDAAARPGVGRRPTKTTVSPAERQEALVFLVHLVGFAAGGLVLARMVK